METPDEGDDWTESVHGPPGTVVVVVCTASVVVVVTVVVVVLVVVVAVAEVVDVVEVVLVDVVLDVEVVVEEVVAVVVVVVVGSVVVVVEVVTVVVVLATVIVVVLDVVLDVVLVVVLVMSMVEDVEDVEDVDVVVVVVVVVAAVGFTVTVNSSCACKSPSSAVSRSTYAPASLKLAAVSAADALPNTTAPGPLCLVHKSVKAAGGPGLSSSLTAPSSEASAGSVISRSGPASTSGAAFSTLTVMSR